MTDLVNELLPRDLISDTEHSAAINVNIGALDRATAVIKSVLTKVWYDCSSYTQFVLALRDSGFGKLADDLELAIGQENFTSLPSKSESDLSLTSGDKVFPQSTATTDVAKNIADFKKEELFASNAQHQAATSTPDASSLPAKQKIRAARSGDVSDSRFPDGVPPQDRDSSNAVLQPSVYSIPKSSYDSAARHAVTATPHQASQLKQRYSSMSSTTVHLLGSGNFPARRVTSEQSGFRLNSSSQHSAAPNSSMPHLDQFGPPRSISSPPSAACTEPNSAPSESYHSVASDEYTDMHLIASKIHDKETAYFRKAADSRQGEIEELKVIGDIKNSLILNQRSTIQSLTLKIEELTESFKVSEDDKTEAIKTANDAEKAKEESRRQNVATIKNLKQQLRKANERLEQLLRSTKERGRIGSNKRIKKIKVAVAIEVLERGKTCVFNKRASKQLAPGERLSSSNIDDDFLLRLEALNLFSDKLDM